MFPMLIILALTRNMFQINNINKFYEIEVTYNNKYE